MSRKSQITVLDLIVAFTLFIVIVLQNFYMWNELLLKLNNIEVRYYFEDDIRNVVESLITMKGEPVNWDELSTVNDDTVNIIGIASSKNVLDNDKLNKLKETPYEDIQETLFPSGYMRLEISNETGVVYEYGPEAYNQIARIERLVIINDSIYKLTVKGWRN